MDSTQVTPAGPLMIGLCVAVWNKCPNTEAKVAFIEKTLALETDWSGDVWKELRQEDEKFSELAVELKAYILRIQGIFPELSKGAEKGQTFRYFKAAFLKGYREQLPMPTVTYQNLPET